MNALLRIKQAGFAVDFIHPDTIEVSPASKLTEQQCSFIRLHKPEIIECLKSANDETPHRFAYWFEFRDDAGAGTWLTDIEPKDATEELAKRFPNRQIELVALIN